MDKILSGVKDIYLVGIGGIGMSGLALLLKDRGFNVKGSDVHAGYTAKMLQEAGIEVHIGHQRENVSSGTHLLVYSSAVKADNPEIVAAKELGITILKRGELLGLLCWDKKTVAVAGSHGKTTTTALLGYLLTSLGHRPTVFVGGLPLNYTRNAWWGDEYFVIETDESDGSFLQCNPWVSIITNIDCEHLDYHKTIENLRASFLKFAYHTKHKVFGYGDDYAIREIISSVNGITYGFDDANYLRATNFHCDGFLSCFDLIVNGKFARHVKTPLLGKHNVLNTLAVLGFFLYLGEDLDKVIALLGDFKGTKRRFQVKAKIGGVTFVDDYAHHPTEIKAVLGAASYLEPKRLVVIFQPHRFSRVQALYKEFSKCFSLASALVVTDIYSASEKIIEGIDTQFLVTEIKNSVSCPVHYLAKEKLAESVPLMLEEGDLVIGIGAGDINIIMDGVVDEFKKSRCRTAS